MKLWISTPLFAAAVLMAGCSNHPSEKQDTTTPSGTTSGITTAATTTVASAPTTTKSLQSGYVTAKKSLEFDGGMALDIQKNGKYQLLGANGKPVQCVILTAEEGRQIVICVTDGKPAAYAADGSDAGEFIYGGSEINVSGGKVSIDGVEMSFSEGTLQDFELVSGLKIFANADGTYSLINDVGKTVMSATVETDDGESVVVLGVGGELEFVDAQGGKLQEIVLGGVKIKLTDGLVTIDGVALSNPKSEEQSKSGTTTAQTSVDVAKGTKMSSAETVKKPVTTTKATTKQATTTKKSEITAAEEERVNTHFGKLLNKARKDAGVSGMEQLVCANTAANARAKELATKYSHERSNGESGYFILNEYGISWTEVGENIACGQDSEEMVFDAWMNSAGHRENILNSNLTKFGFGQYEKDGVNYWVLLLYV